MSNIEIAAIGLAVLAIYSFTCFRFNVHPVDLFFQVLFGVICVFISIVGGYWFCWAIGFSLIMTFGIQAGCTGLTYGAS